MNYRVRDAGDGARFWGAGLGETACLEAGNLAVGLLGDESMSYKWSVPRCKNHCACAHTNSENGV